MSMETQKTTFKDLPGWYASPVIGGFHICRDEDIGAVGFYDTVNKTMKLDRLESVLRSEGKNDIGEQGPQKCKNLHQAMRLTFLLLQTPETLKNELTTFDDLPGWKAKRIENGVSLEILNPEGKFIAHYIGNRLYMYLGGSQTEMKRFTELHQAMRYAFLKTQMPNVAGKIQPTSPHSF